MTYSVRVPNGIITMCETDFNCPICQCLHTEEDYDKAMKRSSSGSIYKNCKGCKRKIGVAIDFKGDIHVWEPEDKTKLKNK